MTSEEGLIPKILHTCWYGEAPMPELHQRCMATWYDKMPGWRVRVWNEANTPPPVVLSNPFVRDAWARGSWAFVSDFMRLWTLYHEGGIYMDADVEVLRPLDVFRKHRAFTGHETSDLWVTATMGAEPHHPWIEMLLNYYEHQARFDGVTPNTQIITQLSRPWEYSEAGVLGSGFRVLREGVVIYPVDVLCPFDHHALRPTPTADSYAVHHFAGSWTSRHGP